MPVPTRRRRATVETERSRTRQRSAARDLCDIELFDPEKVNAARKQMLPDDHVERLSSVFHVSAIPPV